MIQGICALKIIKSRSFLPPARFVGGFAFVGHPAQVDNADGVEYNGSVPSLGGTQLKAFPSDGWGGCVVSPRSGISGMIALCVQRNCHGKDISQRGCDFLANVRDHQRKGGAHEY
jgi:hypothetical protein